VAGERILVVDDNLANVKLARFVLERRGFVVRVATNGPEAMREIEAAPPRLVLMDLQLPGVDGLTLTRQLKAAERTRGIVIVAFTAFAMEGDREKALAAGCDGYLTKPIDTGSFADQVTALLSASERRA
jgi:CheY-like chemotaxis protein